jgi:hypothetical protein
MTTPVSDIEDPRGSIVPFPCGEQAEDRNWLNVVNILEEIRNYIRRIGTLLAQCVADDDGCNGEDVRPSIF